MRDQLLLLLYRACLDYIRKFRKARGNVATFLDRQAVDLLAVVDDEGYPENSVDWLLRLQAYLDRTGGTVAAAMVPVPGYAVGDHERITEEQVVTAW